jgi:hypothetical protein
MRQRVRYTEFRGGMPSHACHPIRCPEHQPQWRQGHRRPDDAACRLRDQPEEAEAHRECFGWLKGIALMRTVRHRGIEKVGWVFTFAAAAYNLVRLKDLLASPVGAA